MNNNLVIAILLLSFKICEGFVILLPNISQKRCYYTQHSPDKTLQVKLGLLRKQRLPCQVKFTVFLKDGADRVIQKIHDKSQRCQEGRFRQSYVVKHTSSQETSQFVTGNYQICIQTAENQNNVDVFAEIFIGQKLNPVLYEHSENPLPLVEARQILDLDLTVQSIKRGLVKSQAHAKSIKSKGDELDAKISKLMSVNDVVNIMQIFFLLVFGFAWVHLVSKLKKTQNQK